MPRVLACPTCNASLPRGTQPGDHVTCGFCGNSVVVPPTGTDEEPGAVRAEHAQGAPAAGLGAPPSVVVVHGGRSGGGWLRALVVLIVLGAVAIPVASVVGGVGSTLDGVRSVVEDAVGAAVGGGAVDVPAADGASPGGEQEGGPEVVFGGAGTGAGLLDDGREIGVDGEGFVYVGEFSSGRIQRFTRDGQVSGQWLVDNPEGLPLTEMVVGRDGTVVVALGFQLHRYRGATGEPLGRLVVNPSAVLEFFAAAAPLPDGGLLVVQSDGPQPQLVWLGPDLREVRRVAPPELASPDVPERVAVDGQGTIYALGTRTTGGDREAGVLVFDAQGAFRDFLPASQGPGALISGLAVDGRSRVAVSDFGTVRVFEADGTAVRAFDVSPAPRGLAFDPADGRLWVSTGSEVRAYAVP